MYPGFNNNNNNNNNNNTNSYPTASSSSSSASGGYPTAASVIAHQGPTNNTQLSPSSYQQVQQSYPGASTSLSPSTNYQTPSTSYPSASSVRSSYPGGTMTTSNSTNHNSYPSAMATTAPTSSSYDAVGIKKTTSSSSSSGISYPSASSVVDHQSNASSSTSTRKNHLQSKHSASSTAPTLYPGAKDYSSESVYAMLGNDTYSSSNKKTSTTSSSSSNYSSASSPSSTKPSGVPSSKASSHRQSSSSSSSRAKKMHNPVHVPYVSPHTYEEGKVKALLIGINYRGQDCELDGCVADVHRQLKTLERIGFPIDECVVLTDDPKFKNNAGMPTKSNIFYWMNWLTANAESGDVLFLHVSGHGVSKKQPPDTPPEEREESGMDQFLVPLDHARAGLIRDDDLFDVLVRKLPPGVRSTIVMDCCKSGSLVDLQFEYRGSSSSSSSSRNNNYGGFVRVNNKKHGGGDVVVFSAASDFQTAADVSDLGGLSKDDPFRSGGAMTAAFNEILTSTSGLTFTDFLKEIRRTLRKKKFTQVPQLSATRPIDVNKTFSLFGTLEKVQVQAYQPPPWSPPKQQFTTQSFAFPTLHQAEWTPPSESYNVADCYYPSASSVLKGTSEITKSVY